MLKNAPSVDAGRLRKTLEALSVFGRPPGGTFDDGVSRVAYSEADIAGRAYVAGLMTSAGLAVRIDPAGNIIGRKEGSDPKLLPLLMGSHIDTVPGGGNFDGNVGCLGAIEVVQTLADAGITTRHPLEVVIWANEEGVAFGKGLWGSRAAAGKLDPGELDDVSNGVKKADAVRAIGGDPDRIDEAQRAHGSFLAYLELHVEQGGILDAGGVPIGVVEGIVAVERYAALVTGFANHAGTTPMADRQDALIAAARLVIGVNDIVTAEPGRQVGTVGKLNVTPNAVNVIPGQVSMTIELRDLSAAKVSALAIRVKERGDEIAAASRTKIDITLTSEQPPALCSPDLMIAIEHAAVQLGLQHQRLPSGAGHDAQMIAQLGPMAMIFVPSVAGISHSPHELSRWEDVGNGANVLLQAVLALTG